MTTPASPRSRQPSMWWAIARRQHHPHVTRLAELADQVCEVGCASDILPDEARDRLGILVEDDAVVALPHQPAHEVGAHPSQADHAELHPSLPFVSRSRSMID